MTDWYTGCMTIQEVETVSDARASISRHIGDFRSQGMLSAPVLIGSHRKPEAALIPAELYEQLLPRIEELRLEALVARRLATEKTHPMSELIKELGFEGQIK